MLGIVKQSAICFDVLLNLFYIKPAPFNTHSFFVDNTRTTSLRSLLALKYLRLKLLLYVLRVVNLSVYLYATLSHAQPTAHLI